MILTGLVGGSSDNLVLKPPEEILSPPGISVLKGGTPAEVAAQMRKAFPKATYRDTQRLNLHHYIVELLY
jgi:hypothetical protein